MVTQDDEAATTLDRRGGAPVVRTARLALRPLDATDAADIVRLAGDWQVARMLADMPSPLDEAAAKCWMQGAADDLRLAILLEDRLIGNVSACWTSSLDFGDVGSLSSGGGIVSAELGFWLGRPWWGYGYAMEAAGAVVADVRAAGGGAVMTSGHFEDNPASGRVLTRLGFEPAGRTEQWCLARRQNLPTLRYALPLNRA